MNTNAHTTVSFTARRIDKRCRWWAVRIPAGDAARIDLDDSTSTRAYPFLQPGADLELRNGDAVLISEQRHHTKMRGYDVALHVAVAGAMRVYRPDAGTKARIKAAATPEQWRELCRGSGDVAAALIRVLKALSMFDRGQLARVFPQTAAALDVAEAGVPLDVGASAAGDAEAEA